MLHSLKKIRKINGLFVGLSAVLIFSVGILPESRGDDPKVMNEEKREVTQVPEQDPEAAACLSNDPKCSRWYYLTEKPRPEAWDSDHPAHSKRQRWYHVNQPAPPPEPRIIVLEGVNFDFDKSDIRSDAVPILEGNLSELQSGNIHVTVVGHTDERGTEEYNQRLSERRAESVRQYYINRGIPAERLSAEGRGELEPILANEDKDDGFDTPDENKFADRGRAMNRRIELHIEDVIATSSPQP